VTCYGLEAPVALHKGEGASSKSGRTAVSRETEKRAEAAFETFLDGRDAINKLAAAMPQGDMQQSMIAMNAMNQYNAQRFGEAADEIEEAKRAVAGLLFRARTGEADAVSEEVAKDALVALDKLVDGLARINQDASREMT
jgi:hypothetical protein